MSKTYISIDAESVRILKQKYPGSSLSHAIDLAARDLDRADGSQIAEALAAFAERQSAIAAAQQQTLDRILDVAAKLADAHADQGDDRIAEIINLLTGMTGVIGDMAENMAKMSGDTLGISHHMHGMSETLTAIGERVT